MVAETLTLRKFIKNKTPDKYKITTIKSKKDRFKARPDEVDLPVTEKKLLVKRLERILRKGQHSARVRINRENGTVQAKITKEYKKALHIHPSDIPVNSKLPIDEEIISINKIGKKEAGKTICFWESTRSGKQVLTGNNNPVLVKFWIPTWKTTKDGVKQKRRVTPRPNGKQQWRVKMESTCDKCGHNKSTLLAHDLSGGGFMTHSGV